MKFKFAALAFAALAAKVEPLTRQHFALSRFDATLCPRLSLPEEGREGVRGRIS